MGVRQELLLSPLLFSLYERIKGETVDGVEEGLQVEDYWLKEVRFEDWQSIVASKESD